MIITVVMGRMDEILQLRREQLRAGRDHLEELLTRVMPEWDVPQVDGGIVTWIGLGSPVSSQLALAARREGLIITAGPRFGIDGAFERFLWVPICYPETTDAAVRASREHGARSPTHRSPSPSPSCSPRWSEPEGAVAPRRAVRHGQTAAVAPSSARAASGTTSRGAASDRPSPRRRNRIAASTAPNAKNAALHQYATA